MNMKTIYITLLALFLLTSNILFKTCNAARECGKTPIPAAAASMTPCLAAARNTRARVTPPCCSKVTALIKTAPRCLCAVILSPLARQAGINPGIAITIPKRCNIRNRPIGKKCGRYVVP
ncbi:non-specific lipid transfer protein GPI-anchored 15 [Amaranthus tricolor]|uniref:non-specific lipid transfer protein GPI-anchored 15 n=1 Tax=Amaranthus tricolor TaxID=29722 RepID=UPI00258945CE|nr:non-specific lipid transfer protein GPI-anchored 15 [Amaranthus tricolor]